MTIKEQCLQLLEGPIATAKQFPWESKYEYALWSAQTYYFVKYATRLLSLAASRCELEDNNFHFRFLTHLQEEKGHENLSESDVNFLNYKITDLPQLTATKSFYQTQYYWIEHCHPYAFFGYFITLEALAVHIVPEVHQRVIAAHGERAGKFLKIHTEEDIEHLEEAFQWLDRMPQNIQSLVMENLEQSANNYNQILWSVIESGKNRNTVAA